MLYTLQHDTNLQHKINTYNTHQVQSFKDDESLLEVAQSFYYHTIWFALTWVDEITWARLQN